MWKNLLRNVEVQRYIYIYINTKIVLKEYKHHYQYYVSLKDINAGCSSFDGH